MVLAEFWYGTVELSSFGGGLLGKDSVNFRKFMETFKLLSINEFLVFLLVVGLKKASERPGILAVLKRPKRSASVPFWAFLEVI